jgi:hypothetical protein
MQPISIDKQIKDDDKFKIKVFFDIESMQILKDNLIYHEPNLLIARFDCKFCENKTKKRIFW